MVCKPEKIYGHEHISQKLFDDASKNKISGAYLFVGPSKIGKFTAARILARRLQCEGDNCRTCSQTWRNIHPDTLVVDRLYIQGKSEDLQKIARRTSLDQQYRVKKGIKTDTIAIDDIRQIIARMSQKQLANYKITLIHRAERLNIPATNALLKFIEELPEKSIVIMTATDEERLLPTLVSRCQIIRFHNLDEKVQITALQEMFPRKTLEQIEQSIWLAQGRIGRAISFLQSKKLMATYIERYRQIEALFERSNLTQRFEFIAEIISNPNDITRFLRIFTYFARNLLQAKINNDKNNIATNFSLAQLNNLLVEINTVRTRIKSNANARLQLENLVMKI